MSDPGSGCPCGQSALRLPSDRPVGTRFVRAVVTGLRPVISGWPFVRSLKSYRYVTVS